MPLIKADGYNIEIGTSIFKSVSAHLNKNKYSKHFIVCDSNTLKYCLRELILNCPKLQQAEIIELDPGEESKDINLVSHIWQTLTENNADKKSLLINLGGGVVSDIGGFAASTFKRGISFINIPTTLLAMADASVGGKTGINFGGIKNHIGTFHQPKAVFIYPEYLRTLPHEHWVNGFAEIVKISLINNKSFFKTVGKINIHKGFTPLIVITKSVELKNVIVKKDPNEKGLRKTLNFGHTVGHAMESLHMQSVKPLLHGEAVAIGMAIESYLSLCLKLITQNEFDEIMSCLKLNFRFPQINMNEIDAFYKYFKQDKKHSDKTYKLVLLNGIGQCKYDVKVTNTQLDKAILYYNTKISDAASV